MKDNEIVIALRAVAKSYEGKPLRTFETNINAMATDAANHIERLGEENNILKAEVERLQKEIENLESMQEISPEAKYLVDTKADNIISLLTEITKSQEQIKAEARKEFVEKLKLHSYIVSDESKTGIITRYSVVTANQIDNLVKEMEGK